ncbi:MAG: TatD family hydrolase [Acidobacteria bacterium]|nr:TatD family hydrolase [Acidobacteriota bacterium]
MAFTDSHAHLADERFDTDRTDVLARARQAGVERILTIAEATRPDECRKTLALADQHEFVWAALGVHPHEARRATEERLAELETLLRHPRVLAWGEIGLDYYYDHSPRSVQQAVFRGQLKRARTARLPVIVHCREAWNDCLKILSEEWGPSSPGGILHCFSGTAEVAGQALDWGFLISFAGNVTFPRAENLRAVARAVPLERLLIETDCPYLAPQPVRGKRNEPAYVMDVAVELGRLHRVTREEMGAQTSENFLRLFPGAGA